MKKLIVGLLALSLCTTPVLAQDLVNSVPRVMLQGYDLTAVGSGSAVACSPIEQRIPTLIVTSGSSATTAAKTTGTNPFQTAVVGDVIRATTLGTGPVTSSIRTLRIITAKASADSITVGSAWNLGAVGVSFDLIKSNCSAIAGSGPWIPTLANYQSQISFSVSTINVTGGISFRIEGLFSDENDVTPLVSNLWPGVIAADAKCPGGTYDGSANCNYTAVTNAITFNTTMNFKPKAVRLVMFIGSSDTGVQAINMTLTEIK